VRHPVERSKVKSPSVGSGVNARYFETNAEFWLNLQNFYDLECERRAGKASEIERQVQPVGAE